MKRTAILAAVGFAVGIVSQQRLLVQVAAAAAGIVVVLVLLIRRRRRRFDQEQLARLDEFVAHKRALHQLAADARRRPDFPKLPRI